MTQQRKQMKISSKNKIERKDWNKQTSALPYLSYLEVDSCMARVEKSLQNHIEGSEIDYTERGLQNQYQRCGYNPKMLYGWPFHKKHIGISSTFSIFEDADFHDFSKSWFLVILFVDPIQFSARIFLMATLDPRNNADWFMMNIHFSYDVFFYCTPVFKNIP